MSDHRHSRQPATAARPAPPAQPAAAPAGLVWPWLTTERALYAAIALLAAFLRLSDLGRFSLQEAESAYALASWQVLRGEPAALGAAPLLVYGNAIVVFLLGASDATVRLLPALAGVLLALLPAFLRAELGRLRALSASFFLAVSPTAVFFSRRVDPAGLAASLLLALAVVLLRPLDGGRRGVFLAVVLGLLLTSGPLAYAGLPLLALGIWRLGVVPQSGWETFRRPELWRREGVVLGATFLLVSTGLLTNLHGIQEAFPAALGRWLGDFQPTVRPLALLAVYEPLAVVLALASLAFWRRPFVRVLSWAGALGFLLAMLFGGRDDGYVLLAVLPLLLLAGALAGELLEWLHREGPRHVFARFFLAIAPWLFLVYLWLGHFSRPGADALVVLGATPPWLLLLPVGLGMALVVLVAVSYWGGAATLRAAGLSAATILTAFALHTTLNLSHVGAAELLSARRTSTDLRTMAQELGEALDALAYLPGPRRVEVEESLRWPLGWYLRDLPDTRFVAKVADGPAVVVQRGESPPPSPKYQGRRYELAVELREGPFRRGGDRLWRWFVYREAPLRSDGLMAYLRAR